MPDRAIPSVPGSEAISESMPRPQLSSDDVDDLLISAVRYALGRATYIVSWTVGVVVSQAPWLSERARTVMVGDIEAAFAGSGDGRVGHDCDTRDWQRALDALRAGRDVTYA